ncbi:MAG TPA: amino acid adenylation domain-containing protein, partial [Vicinamibacterales bacterium]|nr:amino acid adenylation domain-containing protein [Vicinamibacterales bacterium]
QYADFAAWQRNWLSGAVLADQIEYWKSQLSGAPPSLDLPTDRPRPAVQTFRGARQRVRVSGPITRALKSLNRRQGTTLFMTLLTAFQALIHRWTDQTDILVGVPIAGRQQAETQGLIGFFVNTLVMRGRVRPDAPFQELLAETRDVAMQAYAHQDLPFEKLVEGLGGERDLSRTPLFQVVFALQNAPFKPLDLAELRLEPFEVEQVTAKFDLTLNLAESQDGIQGSLEYNTDLFDAATMERMAGHFETLLEGIVANPAQRVSELPLMSQPERQRLLVEWNATEAALPEDGLIHELVEAQAEKRPDAVAVAYQGRLLGYRELNARANQLARHLRKLGVGPEVPVGILMERSSAMVEGMLGVLKAGGTYLPLDPEAPSDRLQFMIGDAGIRVVLTVESLESDLPAVAHVVCLDRDRRAISQQGKENLESRVDNGNLAYVIYTSGSTGRPKGVGVPHGGLRNLVAWHQKVFGLTPSSRATQIAAPTFDASVWEIWPYLAAGSSVHIPDDVTRNSPADLALWLTTENVTHTFMPTPLAEEVLQEPWPLQTSLEFFLTGGDELRRVPKQALPFRLTNQYGPTENTVVTTWTPVESTRTVEKPPPIGRPIDNVRVYLLDRRLNAVPVGVNGELYIGGSSLSRGYASRADLTAERFVPDPFSAKPGARLYRSGDLCRFSPVGDLEFQGRIDYQVKIRGFRIELGEIEAVLGQFPGVRQAVVLARPDTRGSARLVAYVVPHDGSPDVMALRSYLKASLPEYMVPTAFVTLDTLPLTSNGKVNRRALPAPQVSATEETYLAPRNHHEKRLADMFAEVLGMDRVGVHDNFFEIGGHSLLATKLVSRIRAAFDTRFPLRRVFESPTVFELAKSLTDEETPSRVTPGEELPLLERTRQEGPLPLSFAQQRLWFLDRMEPGNPYYNMPTALRVSGDLRVSALEQAIDEIIRRHEVLQNCYVLQQGQPRQVRMPRRDLTLPIVDLSSLQGASREEHERLLAAADARRPFDLATGPVVRAALLKKGEGSYTILFAMHHVVSDGWSVAIVVRELSALYEALGAGRPSPLPELPIQYADFAVWQRRWLESDGLKSQLSYWKARLGGHLPTLAIRTDRPRPEIESFRGADEILLIPQALAGALNRLSAREHVTLFMTLVAAYKTLLYRNVGQDDIVVGTDLAGRNQAELEGLIGFFVNLLVLRTDLSGNPTFRALLARVRETAMGAFAHQDVPFDRLVEELQPKRHRSRTPLFQMLFVMENIPMETLRLPGLTMTPMPNQADTARFDLALFVREQDGGLVTKWTYKTDLFDRGTIQRMANQYVALLEHIAAAPDTRVNELALQTQAEMRDQALEEQRRREARMSSLVPGRRRARKLAETPGGAETKRAEAEDDAAVVDATKQVRTR